MPKINENKMNYTDWFKSHSKNNNIISLQSRKKFGIINCSINECQNNFVSIMKCYDDYMLILDNTNKLIITLIERNEEKIQKLKYIEKFDLNDIICFTPFGLYLQKK